MKLKIALLAICFTDFFCFELILADCHLDTIFSLFQWNKWDGGTRRYSRTSFKRISASPGDLFIPSMLPFMKKEFNDAVIH